MPKVVRFGQSVCKIRQVLQKSVIIRWKRYIWAWAWKQIRRNWSRKLHVKEPKEGTYIYQNSMTSFPQLILLVPEKLSKTIKSQPSSYRLASDVDECAVEYSCLRTKMYIYGPRCSQLPVSHICICVSCLWTSWFYRTPKKRQ